MFKIESQKHDEVLNNVLSAIKASEESVYISDILLYGSCARGEEHEDSDVDLFVVLKDTDMNANDLDRITRNIRFICSKITGWIMPSIDLHFTVGDNWRKDNSLYHLLIQDDGTSVWM